MIDIFFFVAFNNNILEKIKFKGTLTNLDNVDILKNVHKLSNCIENKNIQDLSNSNTSVIDKIYKYKVNQNKIYFNEQLKLIEFINYNKTDKIYDKLLRTFKNSRIFFLNSTFSEFTFDQLNEFRILRTPRQFIKDIDDSINICICILKYIQNNYHLIVNKDYELINERNSIIFQDDIAKADNLVLILRKRSEISELLLDIDMESTNYLIHLNNLKFINITEQSIIELNQELNIFMGDINDMNTRFNLFNI